MIKYIKDKWFIIAFFLLILFPVYGGYVEKDLSLSGVVAQQEEILLTNETVGNGSYQTYLNNLWENSFPGKKLMLKMRNQLLYTVCQDSPNGNVILGKDEYLYEPSYIFAENQIYAPATDEYFANLMCNLVELDSLLKESGKELYVFITPSKAYYYKENIPNRYMFLSNNDDYTYTNYTKFIEMLNQNNIAYFDSIHYINECLNTDKFNAPVFYKGGIHWSQPWGNGAAAEFLSFMRSNSKYKLSELTVTEIPSEIPIGPDTDLYSSLNLWLEPNEEWYATVVEKNGEGEDYPNIFLRGGSFMGQSLSMLIQNGVFGEDVHLENYYYYMNRYTEFQTISGYQAYDEMNIDYLMGKSDILVLEVNETAIEGMGFGFIEYLLEHPDYLDRNY